MRSRGRNIGSVPLFQETVIYQLTGLVSKHLYSEAFWLVASWLEFGSGFEHFRGVIPLDMTLAVVLHFLL
jgi:hypothetical protein